MVIENMKSRNRKLTQRVRSSESGFVLLAKYNYNLKYYRDIPWEDNYMTEEVVE